jgi:hypothetical protein
MDPIRPDLSSNNIQRLYFSTEIYPFQAGDGLNRQLSQLGHVFTCVRMVHFKIISGQTNSHDSIFNLRISISGQVASVLRF